jgi:hypothetical protein
MTSPSTKHANGARIRLRQLPDHVDALLADYPQPTRLTGKPAALAGDRLDLKAITGKLSGRTNRAFYLVVLGVSLTGAGLAAADWLDWWAPFAFGAVGAVEMGGVALSVHADERRRLGERAIAARLLSASVAGGAVAVNWFGHADHVGQAAFFAGMSALGYLVWLIDSSARRRDWLRRSGKLDEPAPVYGLAQWVRHPRLTSRARTLALADPSLGRFGSLAKAREDIRAARRHEAVSAALRKQMTEDCGEDEAQVVVNIYDPEEVAKRLAAWADYDDLAKRIGRRLTPERIAQRADPAPDVPLWRRALLPPDVGADVPVLGSGDVPPADGADVPATATTGSSARRTAGSPERKPTGTRRRKVRPEPKPRRSAEETRKLAADAIAAEPKLTQAELAARLGISDRQLRNVLNPPAVAATPPTTPKETP